MTKHLTLLLCGFSVLAGCAKEPPPRTVTEFLDSPILLEAAMVRCSQDRAKTRYDAECINARQAVARVQAKEEEAEREALEARSKRKRNALRRTQEAAREARRRTTEADRLRDEAEYLAQFGVARPDTLEAADPLAEGNVPVAIVPEAADPLAEGNVPVAIVPQAADPLSDGNMPVAVVPEAAEQRDVGDAGADLEPAADGGNAPLVDSAAEPDASDLESIREELRRRNEEGGD